MIILGIAIAIFIGSVYLFMQGKQFGAKPTVDRINKNLRSPHFREGQFQNLSHTPALTEGTSYFKVLNQFFFDNSKQKIPPASLPSIKTDLLHLNREENLLVWFGHSSYFMQIDGRTFLVDPVFSGNASPLSFTTKSFKGADIYSVHDLPGIDYLFITHDHWDHLDYKTILALKPKVNKIITGLGVADHLEYWGYDKNKIEEKDWNEAFFLEGGFKVNTVSARHFSGRGFKRNASIWMSFVLTTPGKRIFIGGDSGYDNHFALIGNEFGPFDLVILEDGQYDEKWKYIHMNPEETVQAAIDLKARLLLPVHWAKFNLSVHSWNDPIIRIYKESVSRNMPLAHPKIGELFDLDTPPVFEKWWECIQ